MNCIIFGKSVVNFALVLVLLTGFYVFKDRQMCACRSVDQCVIYVIYQQSYCLRFSTDMVSDIQDSSSSVYLLRKELWSRFRFSETVRSPFFQVAFQATEGKTEFHEQVMWRFWNFFNLVSVTVIKYAFFAWSVVSWNMFKYIFITCLLNIISVNDMILETVIHFLPFIVIVVAVMV